LETEFNLDPDSNPNPEQIMDPDPNSQIISDPDEFGSGSTTLVFAVTLSQDPFPAGVVMLQCMQFSLFVNSTLVSAGVISSAPFLRAIPSPSGTLYTFYMKILHWERGPSGNLPSSSPFGPFP
jgi:hypothetical protein